jgi:proteasome lid subunit RPN8/RPN11
VSASPTGVRLARGVDAAIRREAARSYPHEGCGALLGPEEGQVSETVALPNQETGNPRTRFTVSPRDYMATEESADARGLRLLGFWHSHPDHPARPSSTDRTFAWPGLLTVVVAVAGGEPQEMTAWEVRGPEEPFGQIGLSVYD